MPHSSIGGDKLRNPVKAAAQEDYFPTRYRLRPATSPVWPALTILFPLLLVICTGTASAEQFYLTVQWNITPLAGYADNGWSGSEKLTITGPNFVYAGQITNLNNGCTVQGSASGQGPFTTPVNPNPPASFSFNPTVTIYGVLTFCPAESSSDTSGSGPSCPVTILATPIDGGYSLSTNTVYPPQTCWGNSLVTVIATGFLPMTASISISSPLANATYPLSPPDYDVAAPIAFAATTTDDSRVSWDVNLSYTPSGGKCNPVCTTDTKKFTSQSGGDVAETYSGMGGKLAATATDDHNDTAQVTVYVVGAEIPDDQITSQLTKLYKPKFGGFTPQLLCQIAEQETGGLYDQFKTRMLYGVSADWPLENFAYEKITSGIFIGLMQVPTTMATAFDWLQNTEAGNTVFEQKIAAVLRYEKKELASLHGLPNMSGPQIEDSALSFYGGFLDQSSKAKSKPALHYYIPGTIKHKPAWILNPADGLESPEGISATTYVKGVRKRKVPN